MGVKNVSVIIPAYKPDEKLIVTLTELVSLGFDDIIVVNDGSGEKFAPVFEKVKNISECTLLSHEVNRGKGAALKTAFAFFSESRPDGVGVVTADADGQHMSKDIVAIAEKMAESKKIIIGARDFSDPNVPARSKFGNRTTSAVFRLFFGMKISDTQTGLRAFPRETLGIIASADGDRFEYETNMLMLINRKGLEFEEIRISTVYIEENKSSHFRVIHDSIRIYSLIIKYIFSSCAAALTDAGVFWLVKQFKILAFLPVPLTFTASLAARIISSIINYLINAKVVFGGATNGKTLLKYYSLAVIQITVSAVCVYLCEKIFGVTMPILSTLLKIIVDTILFFISFRVQHKWVFNNKEEEK